MRKFRILLVALVLVSVLVGCSNAQKAKNSELENSAIASFSENKTTNQTNSEIVSQNVVLSTTEKQISTTEIATTEKTTKSEPETTESTTQKRTTTTNSTTTKKQQTTRKPTTTKKQTTTQKQSATAKPSTTKATTKPSTTKAKTTEAPYFCDEGGSHHSCKVGQIGWVNSYKEAQDLALEYIADHDASGNFTVKSCFHCGKYTADVILR